MTGLLAPQRRPVLVPARLRDSPVAWAVAVSVIGSLVWLALSPRVPDLAAQVARANLVRESGVSTWWPGWFGGVTLPDYSVVGPWLMALVGVRLTGAAVAVLGSIAFARLCQSGARPRAGAVAFAVAGLADVADGRITFAIGLAVAAWTLVLLAPAVLTGRVPDESDARATDTDLRRLRVLGLGAGAALSYLCSPLAGLFLGIALAAVAIADPLRRRPAVIGAAVLVAVGGAFALYFPTTGIMPFHPTDIIPAALGCFGVFVLCRERTIRTAAVLLALAAVALLAVPSAIGTNITRLTWVAAAAVPFGFCRLRAVPAFVLALSLAIWPAADLTRQISRSQSPSAEADFYRPLSNALARAGASPDTGQRLEVVDSGDHWAVAYLHDAPALARGWDRQADAADNPIFYTAGALDAQTYHDWLRQLAVGWVAVPNVDHDYASITEARLVNQGLTYLKLVWASPQWTLYRVRDATSLATGAEVTGVGPNAVTLETSAAGPVRLRLRWSAHLTVETADGSPAVGTCLRDQDGWLALDLPAAGIYRVISRFNVLAPLTGASRCIG